MRGNLNAIAVKAPGFGDRKKEILKDIAALTGTTVITEDIGIKIDAATMDMLGKADKIIVTKDKTTIIGGAGKKEDIEARTSIIRSSITTTSSDYDKEKLMERLARLTGGVAVIKVGAATEMEMKNKKYKIEDALNATKAAVEEGIVAGGGTAFVKIAQSLDTLTFANDDEKIGAEIIKQAICYPIKQIAANAGFNGEEVATKVQKSDEFNYGFDAKTGEYKDLVTAGIIDPAKVIRVSLQNAVSAAAMLLTTDAVISDIPKKGDNTAPDMNDM